MMVNANYVQCANYVQHVHSTINVIYSLCNNIDNLMECIRSYLCDNSYTIGLAVFSLS